MTQRRIQTHPALLTALALVAACSSSSTSGNAPGGGSGGNDGGTGPGKGGAGATAGDLGFRAAGNGFKFENYTNDATPQNLTSDEMRRMFGDAVCGSLAGGTCTLTPPAQQAVVQWNAGMAGGHCEGMAAASLLFFTNKLTPTDFGAATVPELLLTSNAKLQRELAYWFTTQYTSPTKEAELKTAPSQIVDTLASSFTSKGETYTLGIYKRGFKDGHAITPYAVNTASDGSTQIMVYDNNYPGQERFVTVDRAANTWKYEASTDPSVPSSLYEGDATTGTLSITPTSARAGMQQCFFCGNVGGGGGGVDAGSGGTMAAQQVQLSGAGDLSIANAAGQTVGYDSSGNVVNTIPGATVSGVTSGDLWKDSAEPVYSFQSASAMTITLDGTSVTAASMSDLTLLGAGYTLAVNGIKLDPLQKDTISFSADGSEVTYKTSGLETPTVVVGVQLAGSDFLFQISSSGEASGQQIDLKIDVTGGKLRVKAGGSDPTSTTSVEVDRVDDATGQQAFTHPGVTLGPNDIIYLDYSTWAGQGQPMAEEVDLNGDGTIDQTIQLSDSM